MYRSAMYDEPLINKIVSSKNEEVKKIKEIPNSILRTDFVGIPNVDETQVVRHFHRLSQMNYGVDSGIPSRFLHYEV